MEIQVKNGYGLYALREFKSSDILGLYMSKFVKIVSNESTSILLEWQLNKLLADGDTLYMGFYW